MNAETQTHAAPPDVVRANKMDLLERLADDLAHEIKNPLHSMVINLEVLKRRVERAGGPDTEDLLRYVGVLDEELERVNRRVELLLRLARPDRGRDPVPLSDVLAELLELLELEGHRRRVQLRYEPHAEAARVRVPPVLAAQALLTLALDVLDRMREGDTLLVRLDSADGLLRVVVRAEPAGPSERASGDRRPALVLDPLVAEAAPALGEALGAELDTPGSPGDGYVLSLPAPVR